jgi:hypothetical protein
VDKPSGRRAMVTGIGSAPLLGRAREDHAHIGARFRRQIDPGDRFRQPFEATGIAARDDHKIPVDLVALAAGVSNLGDEILARDHMGDIFVIMRPLRIELVLDVDAGDTGMDEFPDRAHRVQRLAEPGAGIGDHRYVYGPGNIACGDPSRKACSKSAPITPKPPCRSSGGSAIYAPPRSRRDPGRQAGESARRECRSDPAARRRAAKARRRSL